jgi:hypothetical protein
MTRPKHYQEYQNLSEIVPGVFVEPGDGVYIVDDQGEVVSWTKDEWAEDPWAVTAAVCACILAARRGPAAVRQSLFSQAGNLLDDLIEETASRLKSSTRCCCDNCTWRCTAVETKVIRDFWQRVDPAGEVPVGECPECGALAYLADDNNQFDDDEDDRLEENDDEELLEIDYRCPASEHRWQEQSVLAIQRVPSAASETSPRSTTDQLLNR